MDTPEDAHPDAHCGGCHQALDADTSGVVVAFGNSLWHVDCFKCAKCGNRVTAADTNLLLLSDGSPVCSNCSYNCNVCKKPISDEAIMAGEESYHAACFTCRSCSRRIEELVFAKTSQGIYCMACHNERVARSRRHAEQKQKKEKAKAAARKEKRTNPSTPTASEPPMSPYANSFSPPSPSGHYEEESRFTQQQSRADKRLSTIGIRASQIASPPSQMFPVDVEGSISAPSSTGPHTPDIPMINMPSEDHTPPPPAKNGDSYRQRVDTLPLPDPSAGAAQGLQTPSTKASRRQSVNPGLLWNIDPSAAAAQPADRQHPPTDKSYFSPLTSIPHSPATSSATHSPTITHNDLAAPGGRGRFDSNPTPPGATKANLDRSGSLTINVPTRSASLAESDRGRQQGRDLASPVSPSMQHPQPTATIRRSPSFNQGSTNGGLNPPPIKRSASVSTRSTSREKGRRTPELVLDIGPPPPPPPKKELPPMNVAKPSSPPSERQQSPTTPPVIPPISTTVSDFSAFLEASLQTSAPAASLKIVPPSDAVSVKPPLTGDDQPVKTPSTADTIKNMNGTAGISISVTDDADQDDYVVANSLQDLVRAASLPDSPPPIADGTPRSSSDSRMAGGSPYLDTSDDRVDSNSSLAGSLATLTKPSLQRQDTSELVARRLREAFTDATERGASSVRLDRDFLEAIIRAVQGNQQKYAELRSKFNTMRRASQQVIDGLSVAQNEYDSELAARRDAESEVTRLRAQLSGQAARLTVLAADDRKRDLTDHMVTELKVTIANLESDLAKLRVERDLALTETELLTKKSSRDLDTSQLKQSLAQQFEQLRQLYQKDLEPMMKQKEALAREIQELKEDRNIHLEETTALNARNEELAELCAQLTRKYEMSTGIKPPVLAGGGKSSSSGHGHSSSGSITLNSPSVTSLNTSTTLTEEKDEAIQYVTKVSKAESSGSMPAVKKFMWFKGSSAGKDKSGAAAAAAAAAAAGGAPPPVPEKALPKVAHSFQQQSVLRFARCDHCGDKMWGTQLRCHMCGIACHTRCVAQVTAACKDRGRPTDEVADISPPPPSMFGRDLTEQARADAKGEDRMIPVIVEKCILAVEAIGMDYEGIYRKTGGSGQSKLITSWFERGDYDAFDLLDNDTFNDISSVTSVLKNYFRGLPNPLLTYALHPQFIQAASYRDPEAKSQALNDLITELPHEHYYTLRYLMLHLYRVKERSEENKMNARNLGVVFGPTLMRSPDSSQEFADMAGKALTVEWLIDNAPSVFEEPTESP